MINKNIFYLATFSIISVLIFSTLILFYEYSTVQIGDKLYSWYDSESMFKFSFLTISDIWFNERYWYIAYKLYPSYLVLVNSVLAEFINVIQYKHILFTNILLYFIMVFCYYKIIDRKNLPIFIFLVILFEPSIFAFLLTLEREIFASLILGFFVINNIYVNRKVKKLTLNIFLILILANIRIELVAIILLAFLVFRLLNYLNLIKNIYLKATIIILSLAIFVAFYIKLNEFLLGHINLKLTNSSGGGFGSYITILPLFFRTLFYSIFYFIIPFPIYNIVESEKFLYEYFIVIGGFTYTFFWAFFIMHYKYIFNKNLQFILLFLIIAHIALGGTLFNVRHRVDLIFPLIILFLEVSKTILDSKGTMYLNNICIKISLFVLFAIFLLNIVHFMLKVLLY